MINFVTFEHKEFYNLMRKKAVSMLEVKTAARFERWSWLVGASQVGASGKEPNANVGDVRDVCSIPGLGKSAGGGHDNPL